MGLPKIDVTYYTHYLVGEDKKIKYRPFTVKEQKILLKAKESGDEEELVDSIFQIIELCTKGLDTTNLAFFDVEDLFVRIRSKSVGELVEFIYKVKDTDEKINVQVNLDDVKVTIPEEHSKKIMLTDTVGVMMKYPSLDLIRQKDKSEEAMLKHCIDYIFDDEEVYYFKDFSEQEVDEWMEQFDLSVMKKIYDFFNTMPRIRYEQEVELSDGRKETLKFEGLEDLFT